MSTNSSYVFKIASTFHPGFIRETFLLLLLLLLLHLHLLILVLLLLLLLVHLFLLVRLLLVRVLLLLLLLLVLLLLLFLLLLRRLVPLLLFLLLLLLWPYNPWWVLACFTISFHNPLSLHFSVQFLTFIFFKSSSTSSSHLSLGLPTSLHEHGSHSVSFLTVITVLILSILITCAAQRILCDT